MSDITPLDVNNENNNENNINQNINDKNINENIKDEYYKKIAKINVGGEIFTTTKLTLQSSTYFQSLFDSKQENDDYSTIMIDRDPIIFRYILNCLRSSDYIDGKLFDYKPDLIYFGVEHLLSNLNNTNTTLKITYNKDSRIKLVKDEKIKNRFLVYAQSSWVKFFSIVKIYTNVTIEFPINSFGILTPVNYRVASNQIVNTTDNLSIIFIQSSVHTADWNLDFEQFGLLAYLDVITCLPFNDINLKENEK